MDQESIRKLEVKLPGLYKDNSCDHNINHISRVVKNARIIGEKEGVDLSVLIPAAMLHDIALKKGTLSKTASKHALLGAKLAEKVLKDCGFEAEKIKKICSTIKQHSIHSSTNEPRTIEGDCLFDADKLDAINTCGFTRYIQEQALEKNRDPIDAAKELISFLENFELKTRAGKELDKERDKVIEFCRLAIKSGQV